MPIDGCMLVPEEMTAPESTSQTGVVRNNNQAWLLLVISQLYFMALACQIGAEKNCNKLCDRVNNAVVFWLCTATTRTVWSVAVLMIFK